MLQILNPHSKSFRTKNGLKMKEIAWIDLSYMNGFKLKLQGNFILFLKQFFMYSFQASSTKSMANSMKIKPSKLLAVKTLTSAGRWNKLI